MAEVSEFKIYDVRCKDVLEEKGVRFAGILDKSGKLIAGGFKPGVVPLEKNDEKFKRFLDRVITISFRKENEATLGKLNYVACRRDKLVLISFPFPLSQNILLISAETFVNLETLATKITRIFGGADLFSEWDMKSNN